MPHTGRKAANRRVARYRAKVAQLRKQARGAGTEEMRGALLERADMYQRIVEAAERDSQEPEQSEVRDSRKPVKRSNAAGPR